MPTTAKTSGKRRAAPARKSAPPGKARPRAAEPSPYHHGDLQQALLEAAEKVLERDGLQGLTLRAVAREAGVSHAAPTHHFGDLTGLVSELAAIGFRRFNATMAAAGAIEGPLEHRAMARAQAYLAYARARPGMYLLMFRTERLDMTRPTLHAAAEAAFAGLASVVSAKQGIDVVSEGLGLEQAALIARAWSLVHGYTMLLLDGRLNDILRRLPEGTKAETLFAEMLKLAMGPKPNM